MAKDGIVQLHHPPPRLLHHNMLHIQWYLLRGVKAAGERQLHRLPLSGHQ